MHAGAYVTACSACSSSSCVAGKYLIGCGGASAGSCTSCPSGSYRSVPGTDIHPQPSFQRRVARFVDTGKMHGTNFGGTATAQTNLGQSQMIPIERNFHKSIVTTTIKLRKPVHCDVLVWGDRVSVFFRIFFVNLFPVSLRRQPAHEIHHRKQ